MIYRIIHKTEYIYEEPASLGYNEARLLPRSFSHCLFEQICRSRNISITPQWSDYRERTDFFGNHVLYFTVPQPHEQMTITATSEVEIIPASREEHEPILPLAPAESPAWEEARRQLQQASDPASLEARQFIMNSPLVSVIPALAAFAAPSFPAGRPVLEALNELMARIYEEFDFVSGATTIATPLDEVLAEKRGVCQDFAHLMVGSVRAQGLAARYVSGYLETLPPPGQPKLVGADASHAWCAVYIPSLGWLDFDPTNNLIPHDRHITLAWGRDFSDVTPLKGVVYSTGEQKLHVAVDVERLEPAKTKSPARDSIKPAAS